MPDDKDPFRNIEEKKVCYDYLYLDDYQALNALSSAAGGLEGDSQIEVTKDRGGSVALKFSLWGAGFGLNGSGSRAQRRQFVNRQTIHSQMSSLFEKTKDSVANVKDDGQVSWLKEGYLVKFDGFISPLPDSALTVTSQDLQPFWPDGRMWPRIRAKLSWSSPEKKERERRQSMIGADRFIGLAHIVDTSGELGAHVIALELAAEYAMVARKEDFARRATVFGWVACVPRKDLYELTIETKSGRPKIEISYKDQSALDAPVPTMPTVGGAPNQPTQEREQAMSQPSSSGNAEVDSPRKKRVRRRLWGRSTHGDAETGETSKSSQTGTSTVAAFRPIEPVELAASIKPICIYR